MQLHLYLGAFRTAGHHLANMAIKNKAFLVDNSVLFVSETQFQKSYSTALNAQEQGSDPKVVKSAFLKALCQDQPVDRIVAMVPNLAGNITRPVGAGLIFPRVKSFTGGIAQIMQREDLQFYFSTREPSSFLASSYGQALVNAHMVSFEDYIRDVKLDDMRWSNCLDRLTAPLFNTSDSSFVCRPVVWRFEDYPYIWRDILQALTGVENGQDFVGDTLPIERGLSLYGSHLMFKYLQKHAPKARGDFKKVRDAFVEKYPNTAEKPDDPYWSQEQVQDLQYAYEDDWYFIERMDNIQTIARRVFD